jgi:hypothetical protein
MIDAAKARELSKKGSSNTLEESGVAQRRRDEAERVCKKYLMEVLVPRLESDILQQISIAAETTGARELSTQLDDRPTDFLEAAEIVRDRFNANGYTVSIIEKQPHPEEDREQPHYYMRICW